MKLMIASDIHGSAYYCEKLISAYEREKAGKFLLLGDLLYHGARNDLPEGYSTKAVTAMLNSIKNELLCVRGNCDSDIDQMVLDFPMMADYCFVYFGERMIFATHGHKYNEEILPPLKPGDILLNGHTHVAGYNVHEDYVYMNPGSVSLPKNNTPHGYIVLEDGEFIWKDLDGKRYNSYK